ncbi:MAG: hypothetical protein WCO35_00320 [Candidatus Nomurabacteria bacterium]
MTEEKMNSKCGECCGKYGNGGHHGPIGLVFKVLKIIIMIAIAVILVKVAVNFDHPGRGFSREGQRFSQDRGMTRFDDISASSTPVQALSTTTIKK